MKLTLFSQNKTTEFFLPNQISGSYSFDENPNADIKLMKVEASNDKWVLSPINDTMIQHDGVIVEEIPLVENDFYGLKREEDSYLLLSSSSYEPGYKVYEFNNNVDMLMGNTNDCNIRYDCPFINSLVAEIIKTNDTLMLANSMDTLVYLNNEALTQKEIALKPGDIVNILGLKIIVLPKMVMINNPYHGVIINTLTSGLVELALTTDKYENAEVKEVDLYDKKDYFSKSPRIRRTIEKKSLKIDKPPSPEKNDNIPLILTAGPMLTMAMTSCLTLVNIITQITSGQTTIEKSWVGLATGILMLISSLLWPLLTKAYNKHSKREERKRIIKLYTEYLAKKEDELKKELINQKNIWEENLLPLTECMKIINTKKNNFWCKRSEQSDFLSVRAGIGHVPLSMEVDWPEEGFTIEEDDLKDMAESMIEQYKYIDECPLEYSFSNNFLTAVMGIEKKCYGFVDNMLLQLMTFYCYDELKIVVFTDTSKASKWDYLKYSNYCFDNDKTVRYFATDIEEAKALGSYLLQDLLVKKQIYEDAAKAKKEDDSKDDDGSVTYPKPHYLIICDNYTAYKKVDFFEELVELDGNIGYSTIIIESKLNHLPSKCINFINLNEGSSGILKNSYEKADITDFHDEISYNVNMMEVTKALSNIPIEIEGAAAKLPNSIEFLEMEKVGKVEQLNILNRWNTNDSTKSLKAEIGVDEELNLMYLDLHEKFHGPHGLIAGTTGSGKSEFIITYILSMAMNYSPDDVAFILIDYKGGGLAYAFENKTTGVKLPHLAGTITNLDKAEMHRTLVSIDSEVKRRQAEFNKARDMLGESTIDIYKYQNFYHEGKVKEPIPHLFLIADEFAELKAQQPDFMDNLISVARIGRSLGVHLILATQKPTGVVNEQIWSNTKFRVCLKVADANDSKEMIKKPDAAMLKQSGRYYLQVGMDEYFALGQSGWAGAKYYPSDTIQKQVDRSINFIDNNGQTIKTIQESNDQQKREAQGEQLAAVMSEIIKVAKQTNKEASRLWLDNVPSIIKVEETEKKYNYIPKPFEVTAIVGEYDAPELQKQGMIKHNYLEGGNTLIIGTDGSEAEKLLSTMIYSTAKNHSNEEVWFYIVDYGSEALRIFANLPHLGGMTFSGEAEDLNNLIKLLNTETVTRKKMFIDYGGDYKNYIKNSGQKLPLIVVIINGYEALVEENEYVYDLSTELFRDSERYGITYIVTMNSHRGMSSKTQDNFSTRYALKLKDNYEYGEVLLTRVNQVPSDTFGRGLTNIGGPHEYQTASIVENDSELSKYILNFIDSIKEKNTGKVKKIPRLPEKIGLEDLRESLIDLKQVPLGIFKNNLKIATFNFEENLGCIITANRINNIKNYTKSMIKVLKAIGISTILIDGIKGIPEIKQDVGNYFDDNLGEMVDKISAVIDKNIEENKELKAAIVIYGIEKALEKINDNNKLKNLIEKVKKYEKIPVIIAEDVNKLKGYQYDDWYKILFANAEGIFVGTGVGDQSVLKISSYSKELGYEYPNNIGFYISTGNYKTMQLVELEEDEEDEQ